jgi:hypothetical protein
MRLLTTRPALALLFAQFAGMMCEFNLVSAWAPVAVGDKVIKCRSPLNVLKYTSDHSWY